MSIYVIGKFLWITAFLIFILVASIGGAIMMFKSGDRFLAVISVLAGIMLLGLVMQLVGPMF